jgi:hypothetical protein
MEGLPDALEVVNAIRSQAISMQALGALSFRWEEEKGEHTNATREIWSSPEAQWTIEKGQWKDGSTYDDCEVLFAGCMPKQAGTHVGVELDAEFDFRNTSYDCDLGFGLDRIAFSDAQWFINADSPWDGCAEVISIVPTRITGRAHECCVIIEVGSGNRGWHEILLVDCGGDRPVTLGQISSSQEPFIETGAVELVTTSNVYLETDARCCPSLLDVSLWRWDGTSLVLAEREQKSYPWTNSR